MSPPAPDEVTVAVLGERLSNLIALVTGMKASVDSMTDAGLEARLAALESWQKWTLRTILALVFGGLIALAFAAPIG